jgi:TnpA family transposase
MNILPSDLLEEIEAFLATGAMSVTGFGLAALNDPNFVKRLRRGADMKLSTIERAHNFLESQTSNNRSDAA